MPVTDASVRAQPAPALEAQPAPALQAQADPAPQGQADPAPEAQDERPPHAYVLRLALAFSACFIGTGIMLPYFPVWLKHMQLSDTEIGTILALPMLVRVTATPFIAAQADRIRDRVDMLVLLSVLGLGATALLFVSGSYLSIALIVLLQGLVVAPQAPLIDAITLTSVRRFGADYGRIRLWGSLTFVATNIAGGALIARYGGGSVPAMLMFGAVVMIFAALISPRFGRPRRASTLSEVHLRKWGGALMRPHFLLILGGGALIQGSHGMLYAFSAIHWSGLGITGTVVGLLWGAGVVAEVVMFRYSRLLMRRIGYRALFFAGGVLATLRWTIFPFTTSLAGFFLLQLFHAGTFAAVYAGIQRVVADEIPEEQGATAQGLLFCLNNAALGLAMYAAGFLYQDFGVFGFLSMAMMALAGLVMIMAGVRLQRKPQPGTGPQPQS